MALNHQNMDMDIKEEVDNTINYYDDMPMEIKTEHDQFRPETGRPDNDIIMLENDSVAPKINTIIPENSNIASVNVNENTGNNNTQAGSNATVLENDIIVPDNDHMGSENHTNMQSIISTENNISRPQSDIRIPEINVFGSKVLSNNPFENVRLEVKKEVNVTMILEKDESQSNLSNKTVLNNNITDNHNSNAQNSCTNPQVKIKEEMQMDENLVSYDFPNFDAVSMNSTENDTKSIDSYEAAALDNVEACLQEEINIKIENEMNYDENEKVDFNQTDVKIEPDLTDMNISYNATTSTANIPNGECDGLPQNALVKLPEEPQIQNNNDNVNLPFQLNSITGDVPSFDAQNFMKNGELFQLNSITGNVLSLEQEASDLLKAQRKTRLKRQDRPFCCPECPKTYTSNCHLRKHLDVHRTIERRAMGVLKGIKTRLDNLKKKVKVDIKVKSTPKKIIKIRKKNKLQTKQEQAEQKERTEKIIKIRKKNKLQTKQEQAEQKERTDEHKQDDTTKDVENNQNSKKEGYECTCGMIFRRRSRMETCLRSHNLFEEHSNCVSCMTCSKSFKNKDELTLHRKRLHRKRFQCKFCPTDYNTRKELFKHLQIHQKVQLLEYKALTEVMKGKHKLRCFMCSKTWAKLSELKSHVMLDHKEPYICPHCKNTFTKIIDFGNHTKTYHPEVEGQSVLNVLEAFSKLIQAWKCQECGQQFLEADKLALHQVEQHSPELKTETQHQCTDCRRVFISQKGLTSHRRIHHSIESTEESKEVIQGIMCLECRKMCKDMTALTSHMRFHSMERKYPCKFCDFRFATPEKRKTHAEIHTGDMKYVCFICEYQCSSENRLKQHKMSLKHANMKEYLLTGKPLLAEEPQTSSKQKIKKEGSVKKRKKEKDESEKKDSDKEKDNDKERDTDNERESDKGQDSDSSSSSDSEEVPCDICGENFSSEKKMLEHKQTHPFIEFPNDDKPSRIFFK